MLQVPTVMLVRFVARVASAAAAWPLPHIGWPGLTLVAMAVVLALRRPSRPRR
jgi:hypothetical protein